MRRRTTTKQLQQAITNNLLHIVKAEVYYKTSRKTETIDIDKFKDSLDFLCESGVFADFVDWHFERNISTKDEYILDSGAMNPYSENVVTVYLYVTDGVNVEDVDRTLLFLEEE
ncbi:hypothetical protein FMM74_020600 [Lachnospiraceae bacterium MD308]|nr:hypothetical protein [Lachnospiraceae bacterium MD308]